MDVALHSEAEVELRRLPKHEHAAMLTAIQKLEAIGPDLPFPHSSQVKGTKLRELRPRAGRSPWRAFYCRVGDAILVGAIGPEANADPRGFERAIRRAITRLEL